MQNTIPQATELTAELIFTTSRSGGPGGQNVNKVNSKVSLKLDILQSEILTDEQKEMILRKLASRITKEGVLMLTSQAKRSQLENKEEVLTKLNELLKRAFTVQKTRRPTKPGESAKQKRIKEKKQRGEKKQWRQKLD